MARRVTSAGMGFLEGIPILLIALARLAWYVAVIVLLVMIWRKVRHLPG